MAKNRPRSRVYPTAKETLRAAAKHINTEQTQSPTYRLAFADDDFLLSDSTRAVRLMLEWSKFDELLESSGIEHTIVMFGSARIGTRDEMQVRVSALKSALKLDHDNHDLLTELAIAERLLEKSAYYEAAHALAYRIARDGESQFGFPCTVITGGGPGIMEACNRGAHDAGADSIGLNIVLPTEQHPNPFTTPRYSFQFHYFAIRKMHFLMRARAIVVFPGGYGTLDEMFETLTLRQTGRVTRMPIILMGEQYWRRLINFEAMVEEGVIGASDLSLFCYAETADEAFDQITSFYRQYPLTPDNGG
ncbi:TIGR00730 family Rossman fold protein [Permianibacter sp. IMCC34836]|uniref:LOG family protein n=1 Tax=Permianibacter fluminis TaxID=2738515 RepID=UPI0015582505|nr:TIGR00730 family Rossman fold protein [Permianibacter fluminis]NQD36967.1 TIGR00730 family Rossman fold protein [Permianibacter fluminis]